jgi:hypothetical protein
MTDAFSARSDDDIITTADDLDEIVRNQSVTPFHQVQRGFTLADADAWLARRRRLEPDVPVLDWSEANGLVPAAGAPVGNRVSAPGSPRREAELPAAPRFEVLRIEWPAR